MSGVAFIDVSPELLRYLPSDISVIGSLKSERGGLVRLVVYHPDLPDQGDEPIKQYHCVISSAHVTKWEPVEEE